MVADFMRYYTGTKISHFSRFHEISNSNLNISWLQFSWDITLCSQYLIVDDFMRYYNRTKISHVCRFHEIFHRNLNISWLHISRLRFRLAHHRTALRYFSVCFKCKIRFKTCGIHHNKNFDQKNSGPLCSQRLRKEAFFYPFPYHSCLWQAVQWGRFTDGFRKQVFDSFPKVMENFHKYAAGHWS